MTRNHFCRKRRPQLHWGGENFGNSLEASNALNCRALGFPAVLSREFQEHVWERFGRLSGKRGHYERGLFAGGISRISKISRFSGFSRKWSDSPLFSTVWVFSRISRISKFSRISRNGLFWEDPFSKRPLFPNLSFGGLSGIFWNFSGISFWKVPAVLGGRA